MAQTIQRVAVVGAGLIGVERLRALQRLQKDGRGVEIAGVFDPAKSDAAAKFATAAFASLDELLDSKPDWVFVATPHDTAVGIVQSALEQGCRVLAEKPLGRNWTEANRITHLAKRADQLFVGFNYRYLDGIVQACSDIRSGKLGRLISINMILAHGHSPDMRTSWKLDPHHSGGGCLIDPGIHLLDLCYLLTGGDVRPVGGNAWSGFWKTGIEEECHLLLESGGITLNLQTSIVRWRSTFHIEIHGEDGYAFIDGRTRSFGTQRYIRGRRWAWREGPSQRDTEELVLESGNEEVFLKETEAVLFADAASQIHPCTSAESLRNMRVLDDCRKMLGLNDGGFR